MSLTRVSFASFICWISLLFLLLSSCTDFSASLALFTCPCLRGKVEQREEKRGKERRCVEEEKEVSINRGKQKKKKTIVRLGM